MDNTQAVVDVAEFQKLQAIVEKLQAEKDEKITRVAELQAALDTEKTSREAEVEEHKKHAEKVAELQAKIDVKEADALLDKMSEQIHNFNGSAYRVSPAFMGVVDGFIRKRGVIELAEGQDDRRQTIADAFNTIIEMAGQGVGHEQSMFVPVSLKGTKTYTPPDGSSKPVDFKAQVKELMAKDPTLKYGDAWEQVNRDNPDFDFIKMEVA